MLVLVSIERNSIGNVISGVLKTSKNEGCKLVTCNLLKMHSFRDHSQEMFLSFKAPLRNLVRGSFLVVLQSVDTKPATSIKKHLSKFQEELLFRT